MNNYYDDKIKYYMFSVKYVEAMGRQVSENNSNLDLYPLDWFSNQDYKLKTEILKEAIEKRILIINTMGYQEIIEGIK